MQRNLKDAEDAGAALPPDGDNEFPLRPEAAVRSMLDASRSWRRWLVDLPRWPKRALLIANDFALLSLALWLALSLRLSTFYLAPDRLLALLLATAPMIGVATFHQMGLYRLVTRFISTRGTARIFIAIGLAVLLWAMVVFMAGLAMAGVPRSVVLIYGVLATSFIWASRQLAGFLLRGLPEVRLAKFEAKTRPVAIYGAGGAGVDLLHALQRTRVYQPVGFIDDNNSLWGQYVSGLKVYRPDKIDKLIARDGVREVLLAVPDLTRRKRREIIQGLTRFPVVVKTLPAMEDIASGRVRVTDLRPLDVDDLLGRDPVPPDATLLERTITGKSVLVTGAGGSIGAELTRQILKLRPARLVLVEISEPALYQIELELRESLAAPLQADAASGDRTTAHVTSMRSQPNGRQYDDGPLAIVPVLGSIQDATLMRATIERNNIQTIYHAAAYKHVPMVEQNPAAGLANNTFGTKILADVASACDVERFILISTDKAVRPTSIMGASKRLAELILQAHAAAREETEEPKTTGTIFTMVRFGNVLDSSGSVVRRFRKQIESGGPVTVTHRDIIRYFMSIPEAAQLVIQAGAMARGGEVFVLDMGEPVKIDQLARSMIALMGLEVQDKDNPEGDIAIAYVGLRPGEKLYEELLIGENATETEHPRIAKIKEPLLSQAQIERELDSLRIAIGSGNVAGMQAILARTVEGYHPRPEPSTDTVWSLSHDPSGVPTVH